MNVEGVYERESPSAPTRVARTRVGADFLFRELITSVGLQTDDLSEWPKCDFGRVSPTITTLSSPAFASVLRLCSKMVLR